MRAPGQDLTTRAQAVAGAGPHRGVAPPRPDRGFAARLLAATLALVAGCGAAAAASRPASGATGTAGLTGAAARDAPVPVVVALVVDQLPAWLASERWPLLERGGFARLRREGTWVRELTFVHAITETTPGHAALFTGVTPRENGFVRNSLGAAPAADGGAGERGATLGDPAHRLVGPGGPTGVPGVSLRQLRTPTLADDLRARDPRAVVVAVSGKDRGAVFGGGRQPDATLWFDAALGSYVTSDAFSATFPAWALPRARPVPDGALAWTPLDPGFLARHAATEDDQAGETPWGGSRAFPHPLPPPGPERARAFRATPFADAALLDLALEAVRSARRPGRPMLLAVSLSGSDWIGHLFGPDSREAWDALLRLDAALGRFLDGLDALVGPDGHAEVLSSDHGVIGLPEVQAQATPPWCPADADPFERPCRPGRRVDPAAVRRSVEAALAVALGPGHPAVADFAHGVVRLEAAARALPADARALLDRAVARGATAVPGVAAAVPLAPLGGPCPPASDERLEALACRSTVPGDGDYLLVPERGSFFSGGSTGTTHGTPYRYDRTVPLLVRHPRGARGRVLERTGFGSFRATAWWALTGERVASPYGAVVGAP